ncbi:MAG: glycosyltransferase family 39 protein [Lentisphaeria bacterium]|nr:glycosyltransferase family 39 protein [Lentisphaeria bacterium]
MTNVLSKQEKILLAGSFLAAAFLLLCSLGDGGIPAAQEGRTAIIVKNMIRSGNWMDMQVPGGILYEKPVGHYWLCLPFAAALHADRVDLTTCATEWAVRLPSALSALLALLGAMLLALRIFGARTAILTVMILSTSSLFLHLGRLAHIDMPLCAAFTWAMFFLYAGYFENMKSNVWIYGFYACLGWGMILKGPLVVILAGLTVLAMMVRLRRWNMIWELRPVSGAALLLLIALPWYVAETIRTEGAFFEEFIMKQNISRFTGVGSTYRDGERMVLWYYIPKTIVGMLPWSLPALAAGVFFFRRLIRLRFSTGPLFLLLWFLTGFVFFSLSALKRGDYLLPVYPALSILTAEVILRGCEKLPPLTRHWVWSLCLLVPVSAAALGLSFSGLLIRFARARLEGKIRHIGRSDANNLLLISSWVNDHMILSIAGCLTALLLIILLGILMQRGRYKSVLLFLYGITFGICAFYVGYLDPVSGNKYRSVKSFTAEARRIIPEGETVGVAGFNTELLYFLDRPYDVAYEADQTHEFLVASDSHADALQKKQPGRWKEVLRTVTNHQYPAVLLRRTEATEQEKDP